MAYQPSLGRLFFFEADDLAANRAGRLSDEQARGYAVMAQVGRRHSRRVLPIFFLLLLGVAGVAVWQTGTGPSGVSSETIAPLALVGVMSLFMISIVLFFRRRYQRDQEVQALGQVLTAQGGFEYDPTWDGGWAINIAGVRFVMELLQYEALDDRATYRAYFLPTEPNATLLSIEKV